MARLILIVIGAFKAWMVVDAIKRHVDTKWFYIILFVPFGGVAYFFTYKLRDPGMVMLKTRLLESLERPPSVEELRRAFKRTASVENRIRLAQGLFDAGEIEEAKAHFETVLEGSPDEKAALHGVGVCGVELGDHAAAVEPLTALVETYPTYRDYEPWAELAEALWQTGEKEQAAELVSDLVRRSPRLRHIVLHARYLQRLGRKDEAGRILRDGLDDDRDSPKHVRRQNRPWAREAQRMLGHLG
jgi:hypothetical protein